MAPNVGLSVTCNTNCSHWCPRVLRVFCCCCTVDEKQIEKTHAVAQPVLNRSDLDSSSIEDTPNINTEHIVESNEMIHKETERERR